MFSITAELNLFMNKEYHSFLLFSRRKIQFGFFRDKPKNILPQLCCIDEKTERAACNRVHSCVIFAEILRFKMYGTACAKCTQKIAPSLQYGILNIQRLKGGELWQLLRSKLLN